MIAYVSFLFQKIIIWFYLRSIDKKRFRKEDRIAIFSVPRSGSTWLSQIISSVPNTVKIDEPLFRGKLRLDGIIPKGKGKLKQLDKLEFFYFQPIPADTDYKEGEDFFRSLFDLKFSSPYLFEETPISKIPKAETLLFKFCYANMLMPWLLQRQDFLSIILVRNPYAVVSSQLNHYAFQELVEQDGFTFPTFQFQESFSEYQETLDSLSKPEEFLAAFWCLNYVFLDDVMNRNDCLLVKYEDLLLHQEKELNRIFSFLGRPLTEEAMASVKKSSASTEKKAFDNEDQLFGWKDSLSLSQIDAITAVLEKFGMSNYDLMWKTTNPEL